MPVGPPDQTLIGSPGSKHRRLTARSNVEVMNASQGFQASIRSSDICAKREKNIRQLRTAQTAFKTRAFQVCRNEPLRTGQVAQRGTRRAQLPQDLTRSAPEHRMHLWSSCRHILIRKFALRTLLTEPPGLGKKDPHSLRPNSVTTMEIHGHHWRDGFFWRMAFACAGVLHLLPLAGFLGKDTLEKA